MKMFHASHTEEEAHFRDESSQFTYPGPTLISPERSFHFGKREDKDGCSSPTNCISFISSQKATVYIHVHIKRSTRKRSFQMWTAGSHLWGQTNEGNIQVASRWSVFKVEGHALRVSSGMQAQLKTGLASLMFEGYLSLMPTLCLVTVNRGGQTF